MAAGRHLGKFRMAIIISATGHPIHFMFVLGAEMHIFLSEVDLLASRSTTCRLLKSVSRLTTI